MGSEQMRNESDSMGQMQVPGWALWGAQTQRAVENFPISGYRFGRRFIRAMGRSSRRRPRSTATWGCWTPKGPSGSWRPRRK